MSRDDLREMFADLAQEVPGANLANAAVAGATRIRRRRRVVAGAAAAVAVSTVAAVVWWPSVGTPPPPSTSPSPVGSATPAIRIDRLPDQIPDVSNAAPYWPASLAPPADAPNQTEAPMNQAVLLASAPLVDPASDTAPPIYAYGERSINEGSGDGSFRWVRLNVNLTFTRDDQGNRALPLDLNSLAPRGDRAAFAQPDAVVVVNLRTAKSIRIPLPGLNEDVSWLADGTHLIVSGATGTWLVNVESRQRVRAAVKGYDVTPLVGGASLLTSLHLPNAGAPPVLGIYDDPGLTHGEDRVIDMGPAGPYRIDYLIPRGWRYGHRIAQAAGGAAGARPGEFVVVIDDEAAEVSRILDLGPLRTKGCCPVLGWIGAGDVLVHSDRDGLLRWDVTGAVKRLSRPAPVIVSVAVGGCDWSIKIDGITSACTQ
jgi:hypothetical protein